ncbi:MAG: 3-deoxy-manno-octulosonate cytidylyltransferase [Planctomycetota bacterium]|jgi:3-deoxy-manno-octulosonate cytidylyltransferase (CMP-KDO synthetase)
MGAAVVIPARLESTRLPRKLLLAETGRPLIAHTVERVLRAQEESEGAITRVLVAADDEALAEAARAAGAEAVMTRADHACGTDRIAEAAGGVPEDVIVNVQGDEPEVETGHVVTAARLLDRYEGGDGTDGHDESDVEMGTLAYPIMSREDFMDPNLVKVVLDRRGMALYFSRAPAPFPREGRASATESLREGEWGLGHLGIYVYRKSFLMRYAELPRSALEEREKLEQLRALEAGEPIRVAVVTAPLGRAVDTREDYDEFRRRVAAEGKIA